VGHQQRSPQLQPGNALPLTDTLDTQVDNAQLLWALQLDAVHFHLHGSVAVLVHMCLQDAIIPIYQKENRLILHVDMNFSLFWSVSSLLSGIKKMTMFIQLFKNKSVVHIYSSATQQFS
jgi:hypothetical protein